MKKSVSDVQHTGILRMVNAPSPGVHLSETVEIWERITLEQGYCLTFLNFDGTSHAYVGTCSSAGIGHVFSKGLRLMSL